MSAPSPGDERLPREERLRRRADYQRCYRQGRRRHGSWMTLHVIANEGDHPRLGITASRKVGKAVMRQRLKRRIRETYRRWDGRRRLPPLDLVVHLKPAAARAGKEAFREELLRLLRAARSLELRERS